MAEERKTPHVVSTDVDAAIKAAKKRIESVPARENLIDLMTDEEWTSSEPDTWRIEAGSNIHLEEIDGLDDEGSRAA